MPYPNEYSCRIKDPSLFQKDSFRRINLKKGLDAIIGKLKGKTTTTVQAYRYKKSIYSEAQAHSHCKKKGGAFEKGVSNMEKKSIKAICKKIKDKLIAVASGEKEDREGEQILASGWKLSEYKKNPVILLAHRYNEPPIGIAKNIRVEGKQLIFEPVFHEITQTAREIKQMYEADPPIMKAFSVGFLPLERDDNKIKKQELLEISAVPVPASREALTLNKSINKETMMKVKNWIEEKKESSAVKEKEIKGVIPYKETPKAPEDTEWNAAREVREADVDDLKIMCAWVDSDNANLKTAYKLPHHKASGNHAVVWNGVRAAMAALFGARGGVDIPSGDRRGVYNHLAKHYKQFDKEVPEFHTVEFIVDLYNKQAPIADKMQNRTDQPLKKVDIEEAQKSEILTDKIIVRALQKMDSQFNYLLKRAKEYRKK